ncbi:MAG: cation diffusion facilitator family transporter [Acetobacter sp.]|nr:cation diffusion facilitator family transporter [Bacteroides sp.]MCM1340475.1 cation diffusion facilitator family transporter [Acetobacter sp.]MCM1433215.1 cation diffusion facilitator family transporter [Clostridiales bacterium]
MIKQKYEKFINKNSLSKEKARETLGIHSGIFSILCNIILCITKFVIGSLTGAVSITADAVNNLSDAGAGIVTIAGTKLSNKPMDEEHPFGHGRIEYISALIISFFIFLMGFELGKSSVEKIINPSDISFNPWLTVILTATILIKLFMAYYNNILFKLTNNVNLKAVRQDSLNDCVATAATIAALIISSLTSFNRADGIIGLAVSAVIIASGISIVKDITGKLLGQPPSPELVNGIEDIILSYEEIVGVHDLIVHDYGPSRIIASAHAEIPSTANVVEIHDIIDNAEKEITKKLNVAMCIHIDPIVMDDEIVEKYRSLTQNIINEVNPEYKFHDFKVVYGETHINLIFDLVTPFEKNKKHGDTIKELRKAFKEKDKQLNIVVTVEHSFV